MEDSATEAVSEATCRVEAAQQLLVGTLADPEPEMRLEDAVWGVAGLLERALTFLKAVPGGRQ